MTKNAHHYKPFRQATYLRPRKNVLVVSYIGLRLTDNLLDFLEAENLQNRYDHFAIAGTSLCVGEQEDGKYEQIFKDMAIRWKDTVLDHIHIAAMLHHIEDVYLVEHEDCGAYKNFLTNHGHTGDEIKEWQCHALFAKELADQINKLKFHYVEYDHVADPPDGLCGQEGVVRPIKVKKLTLNVHTFMMKVSGEVFHLYSKHFEKESIT